MRIDAHQHFWIYDPLRDTWITEDMKKIQHDFLPGDLVPILKENSFDGCIAVQTDQSEKETDFLLELASVHHAIKGVVGWTDLRSEKIGERLEHYSQFPLLKGFRHVVQGEKDESFLLRDDFGRGIAALKDFNFTYDLLIYAHQLPAALAFVEKFPDQKIIIDHIAKPPIRMRQINEWSDYMEQIAKNKNVFCKISGLVTEATWKTWSYDDLVPYLEVATECFGIERLVYGSDWPVCLVAATYREQLHACEKYFRTFLLKEQEAVFGNNATKFYNLT